jgi:Replication-relaxation
MKEQTRKPRFKRVKPPAFVLMERDRRIIELVHEYRLLSSSQITALIGEGSLQQILRRLQLLYHGRFLDRPRTQVIDIIRDPGSKPIVYALGSAGAKLLGTRQPKVPKLQFLNHALAVSGVLVSFAASCRRHGSVRVIPWSEILATKAPEATRKKRLPESWAARVPRYGRLGVTPDAIFGLHYLDRPEGSNRAYFFLEVDRGTMPVVRRSLVESSVYRKLLAYHATATEELHTKNLGIRSFRVLTVTKSPERKRIPSLLDAANKLPSLQGLFLFTDEASLLAEDALTHGWLSGRRETVSLLL